MRQSNYGEVQTDFHTLRDWKRAYTMETLLLDLRKEMATPANKKLRQPKEGETFSYLLFPKQYLQHSKPLIYTSNKT